MAGGTPRVLYNYLGRKMLVKGAHANGWQTGKASKDSGCVLRLIPFAIRVVLGWAKRLYPSIYRLPIARK